MCALGGVTELCVEVELLDDFDDELEDEEEEEDE